MTPETAIANLRTQARSQHLVRFNLTLTSPEPGRGRCVKIDCEKFATRELPFRGQSLALDLVHGLTYQFKLHAIDVACQYDRGKKFTVVAEPDRSGKGEDFTWRIGEPPPPVQDHAPRATMTRDHTLPDWKDELRKLPAGSQVDQIRSVLGEEGFLKFMAAAPVATDGKVESVVIQGEQGTVDSRSAVKVEANAAVVCGSCSQMVLTMFPGSGICPACAAPIAGPVRTDATAQTPTV